MIEFAYQRYFRIQNRSENISTLAYKNPTSDNFDVFVNSILWNEYPIYNTVMLAHIISYPRSQVSPCGTLYSIISYVRVTARSICFLNRNQFTIVNEVSI